MKESDERRRLSIIVDYLFGRGVSKALPKDGLRLVYSRKSGRVKLVLHDGKVFATVKPNGAMALSLHGATVLARSPKFRDNCVMVADEVAEFVKGGKSVFCKFVTWSGKSVLPKGEVTIIDSSGKVLGVGMAVMNGKFMRQFASGVAVKVRVGIPR